MGVAHVGTSLVDLADPERSPGFLVTFRNSANLVLVKVFDDAASDPARPFARAVGSSPISINSVGTDSRGIAVDASARTRAELACGTQFGVDAACLVDAACRATIDAGFFDCLDDVTDVPFDVYVANRTPPSLLVGQTHPVSNENGTDDLPSFNLSVPLTAGPSRVRARLDHQPPG